MAPTIPSSEPPVLVAGATWKWTKQFGAYPTADGWTLSYYFAGPAVFNFAAVANSPTPGVFNVNVAASATAAYTAGTYTWIARVTLPGGTPEVYDAAAGKTIVEPNIATATGATMQEYSEKLLAAVENEIVARLTGNGSAHTGYSTPDGRSISKIDIKDLWSLRRKIQMELYYKRRPGLGIIGIETTFNSAG